MKLSCLPVSIFPELITGGMSIGEWADAASGMGYDGIDLSVLFFPNRTRRFVEQVCRDLKRSNMPVVMMTTYPDFTNPSAQQRERELAYLNSDIALASEIGIKYLRITAGQFYPDLDEDQTIKIIADYFAKSADTAKKLGVELLLENHAKPGAWERPDYDFDPAIFLKLRHAIRDIDIGINFDTANIFGYGGDTLAVLRQVFEKVKTIHIADMAERGRLDYTEIGAGGAPIAEVLDYVKANGFDGWLSIEECSKNGLEGIKRAAATVRTMWAR